MNESEDNLHHSRDTSGSESGAIYTLETVERITHISRHQVVFYYQHGLVSPIEKTEDGELIFDDEAVHKLRRIAFLLSEYGINQDGLKMFSSLISEVERLREEVRFLRKI